MYRNEFFCIDFVAARFFLPIRLDALDWDYYSSPVFVPWPLSVIRPGSHPFSTVLTSRAAEGASAAELTDAVVTLWRSTDAALAPIIGRRGVGALFHRSLGLVAPRHAWLVELSVDAQELPNFGGLRSAFSGQTAHEVATAAGAQLEAFHELLASLIGAPLTERLLRSSWAFFSSGPSVQDAPA